MARGRLRARSRRRPEVGRFRARSRSGAGSAPPTSSAKRRSAGARKRRPSRSAGTSSASAPAASAKPANVGIKNRERCSRQDFLNDLIHIVNGTIPDALVAGATPRRLGLRGGISRTPARLVLMSDSAGTCCRKLATGASARSIALGARFSAGRGIAWSSSARVGSCPRSTLSSRLVSNRDLAEPDFKGLLMGTAGFEPATSRV